MTMSRTWRSAAAGASGGVAGGAVMTALMTQVAPRLVPDKLLPSRPAPLRVVDRAEELTGSQAAPHEKKVAALAAHLGYSAASGAAYALLAPRLGSWDVPAPAAGAAFGLLVWAVSFEALLPALGVMLRTTQQPPARWPAPLVGHAVFGIVTAVVTQGLERRLTRR
jgi:uncharacterized membrane protein YagU involved in acid resistance